MQNKVCNQPDSLVLSFLNDPAGVRIMNFGSVDSPATVAMLNRLASGLRPGQIEPVRIDPAERQHFLEDSTCEHCGLPILRDGVGYDWKHYPSLEEECHPRPKASPKRDAAGSVIPLTGK